MRQEVGELWLGMCGIKEAVPCQESSGDSDALFTMTNGTPIGVPLVIV